MTQVGEIVKNGISRDIFTPIAKIIIGFVSSIELYYLFIEKFTINPTFIQDLTKTNISASSIIILFLLMFIIGYVTCLLGLSILNFSVFIIRHGLKESLSRRLLPLDPFSKGYIEQNGYSKHLFEIVCEHLHLSYQTVGYEFFRLCKIVAQQNEDSFKDHIYSFDMTILRGLLVNSLLFAAIAVRSSNIFFITFSFIVVIVIYNNNKNSVINWKESIYDFAFLTALKNKSLSELENKSRQS